jgi:uncharacterized protein (DUF924 family)
VHFNPILHFWFTELTEKQHFAKEAALATLEAGSRCELFGWRNSKEHGPAGRLAEIIVLDQFSRNVWRDTPCAFA